MIASRYIYLLLFTILLFLGSCSSAGSDAKRAADLKLESIKYSKQGKLEKAEKAYKEADNIMQRYKGTDDYADFSMAYSKAMKANKNQRNR